MTFVKRVEQQIKDAMKAHDAVTLGTLRLLKAAIVTRSVEARRDLDEAECLRVVASLVKQRRESIEQFEKGSRRDLADRERAEISVLETFLPPPVGPADVERAVEDAIAATGATSAKDIGKVMKAVLAGMSGRNVDGRAVNEAVRRRLVG